MKFSNEKKNINKRLNEPHFFLKNTKNIDNIYINQIKIDYVIEISIYF